MSAEEWLASQHTLEEVNLAAPLKEHADAILDEGADEAEMRRRLDVLVGDPQHGIRHLVGLSRKGNRGHPGGITLESVVRKGLTWRKGIFMLFGLKNSNIQKIVPIQP